MSQHTEATVIQEAAREAAALLEQATLTTGQGAYLEGERVAILVDAYPSESGRGYSLTLLIRPLRASADALRGVAVNLHALRDNMVCFGRLDKRGFAPFRDLPPGEYSAVVRSAEAKQPAATLRSTPIGRLLARLRGLFVPVPRPELRLTPAFAPAGSLPAEEALQRNRNAAATLELFISRRGPSRLRFSFYASRDWEGKLAACTWGAASQASSERLILAALAWNDGYEACVADIELTLTVEEMEDVCVSDAPFPLSELDPELAPAIQESIQRTTDACRRVWAGLLERPDLPEGTRPLIAESLRSAGGYTAAAW